MQSTVYLLRLSLFIAYRCRFVHLYFMFILFARQFSFYCKSFKILYSITDSPIRIESIYRKEKRKTAFCMFIWNRSRQAQQHQYTKITTAFYLWRIERVNEHIISDCR